MRGQGLVVGEEEEGGSVVKLPGRRGEGERASGVELAVFWRRRVEEAGVLAGAFLGG